MVGSLGVRLNGGCSGISKTEAPGGGFGTEKKIQLAPYFFGVILVALAAVIRCYLFLRLIGNNE